MHKAHINFIHVLKLIIKCFFCVINITYMYTLILCIRHTVNHQFNIIRYCKKILELF